MNDTPADNPASTEKTAAQPHQPSHQAPPTSSPLAAMQRVEYVLREVLLGQADVIHHVLIALLAGGHVLIEGAPGLGKTLLVKALGQAVHGRFARIQFTPDLMPADITGHTLYDAKTAQFTLRKGPIFANLVLADEINRAPAKTQAALLEAMQEGQVTIDGHSLSLPQPFMVIATENPIDQEGTYPLPEAQLDRFLFKILIDYPAAEHEAAIVRQITHSRSAEQLDVSRVPTCLDSVMLNMARDLATHVRVDDSIVDYAVRIVRATRETGGIAVGASPRASIALIRGARANAWLDGRSYVLPEDIKQLAYPVLRHRIVLHPELDIEGIQADTMLAQLLNNVAAPRQ